MITPRELQKLYKQGTNITQLLKKEKGLHYNSDEIIEIAYDLQAGSYIAAIKNEKLANCYKDFSSELARTILSLCEPMSIMEAGVGEATTFSGVLKHLKSGIASFGFDLSWSRVAYAREWLQKQNVSNVTLCTGNLFHIPFTDNSIDVVYTSNSIEPNGGNEEQILRELFRVTRRFLILLEPAYELAGDEARQRMDSHGYCKNLVGVAENLGYTVLKHSLFPFFFNPLNPTAITIIAKGDDRTQPAQIFACPQFKTPLEEIDNMLFSPEALVVYPVLNGIPCLRIENAILASKYKEIVQNR